MESEREIRELEPKWNRLFAECPDASPFQSYAWQMGLVTVRKPNGKPILLLAEEGDELSGLWFLWEENTAWRSLRSAAVGPSDLLPPLARTDEARNALAGHVSEIAPDYDLVDLHELPCRFDSLCAGEWRPQATRLVIDLPGSFEEYAATLSSSLRSDLKKGAKLGASFRLSSLETIEQDLQAFFTFHRQRWNKKFLPGSFFQPSIRAFHSWWAKKALEQDLLRFWNLEVDGRRIGCLYAMKSGTRTYFYQSGFDPAESSLSPGSLLVGQAIRSAIEDGCLEFDMLRGDEPYKRRWKPTHTESNDRYIQFGTGVRAQLARHWLQRAMKVEDSLRERFEGGNSGKSGRQ